VSDVTDLSRAMACFTDPAGLARYGRATAWERIQVATY
jgi:hypothetical protein